MIQSHKTANVQMDRRINSWWCRNIYSEKGVFHVKHTLLRIYVSAPPTVNAPIHLNICSLMRLDHIHFLRLAYT